MPLIASKLISTTRQYYVILADPQGGREDVASYNLIASPQ